MAGKQHHTTHTLYKVQYSYYYLHRRMEAMKRAEIGQGVINGG
jgi:hypothetical protein